MDRKTDAPSAQNHRHNEIERGAFHRDRALDGHGLMAADRPRQTAPTLMEEQREGLDRLHKELTMLEHQLLPLLRDEPEFPQPRPAEAHGVKLLDEISAANAQLHEASVRIASLRDRLAL